MASPRISVVLVVAGVLAAAGGAAYYFFAVFSVKERLREAQLQVTQWEEQWGEARSCLLGRTPLAATLDDAIVGRELALGSTDALADCTRPISRLTRPSGNNTGIDGVEAAWQKLEEQALAVARGYVAHLEAPMEDATFSAALGQLEAARAELHRQVELRPRAEPMGPAPRELQLSPLTTGGEALTELLATPAGDALVGRAAIGERWLAVRVRRGEGAAAFAVDAHPLKPDVVAAVPEATWGAVGAFESKGEKLTIKLQAGALDAEGAVTAPVVAAAAPTLVVGAALGNGPTRAVIYVDGATRAAVSKDGGASWKSSLLSANPAINIFPSGLGYADVVWQQPVEPAPGAGHDDEDDEDDEEPDSSAGVTVSWLRVAAANLPALGTASTVPAAAILRACPAAKAPWALLSQGYRAALVRMDRPTEKLELPVQDSLELLGCDDDAVLLAADRGRDLWTCTKGECRAFPWRGGESGSGAVVDGKAMYVAARRQLLAVLSADGPPQLVRLPAGAELHSLIGLAGAPYLVLEQKGGALAVAPLPR